MQKVPNFENAILARIWKGCVRLFVLIPNGKKRSENLTSLLIIYRMFRNIFLKIQRRIKSYNFKSYGFSLFEINRCDIILPRDMNLQNRKPLSSATATESRPHQWYRKPPTSPPSCSPSVRLANIRQWEHICRHN